MHESLMFEIGKWAAALVFFAGVWGNVSFWLTGSTPRGSGRIAYAVRRIIGLALSPRAWGRAVSVVIFQKGVGKGSPARTVMHLCLALGLMELFFIGSGGNALIEYGLADFTKDTAWFALANEIGGLLLIVGAAIAISRRYVLRLPQLRAPAGTGEDAVIAILIGLGVVTGYFAEASRLLADNVAAEAAANSFVGYGIARIIEGMGANWHGLHASIWWMHAALGLAFFAYVPFSRLFHVFSAVLLSAADEGRPAEPQTDAGSVYGVSGN